MEIGERDYQAEYHENESCRSHSCRKLRYDAVYLEYELLFLVSSRSISWIAKNEFVELRASRNKGDTKYDICDWIDSQI